MLLLLFKQEAMGWTAWAFVMLADAKTFIRSRATISLTLQNPVT